MAALVYATRTDLVSYAPSGTTVPDEPEAVRLLTSASKVVLWHTKTAVYTTDSSGYPTDTAIRQAFRDATCAQALWWIENPGAETGTAGQYDSVSILSVTLTRRSSAGGSSGAGVQELAPQAYTELANAGVLPGVVQTWT